MRPNDHRQIVLGQKGLDAVWTKLDDPSGPIWISRLISVFENMNFYCTTLQILFYGQNTNFDLYNKYNVQMFCKMKII